MRQALWLGFAALGPLTLALGLWRWFRLRAWRQRAVRTQGTLVDWEHDSTSAPVVEFTTREGRLVRKLYVRSGDSGYYPVGKPVPVWYDPADPEDFWCEVRRGAQPGVPLLLLSVPLLWMSWRLLLYWFHHR